MIHKQHDDLRWLEFELLAQFRELRHGVFLRHGGYSQGAYDSLNLSTTMGDKPENVEANILKAKSVFGITQLASAEQVHKDGIVLVNDQNFSQLDPNDALTTNCIEIGLKIVHADCQAAIFYDPCNRALATVHCGWRGHVCNIYAKTIAAMIKSYGTNPANLYVAIAPSLGPNHAEFINYRLEFPESFWDFRVNECHFDLWALASWQLKQAKILESHIQIAKMCTYANQLDCFSYRRSKRITGAHGTIACLQDG